MNQLPERLINYLTGFNNLDEVTLSELQQQADEHPYFPVLQFLLAKKMKNELHPGFVEQLQKTTLYFSNPFWLQFQLNNDFPVLLTKDDAIKELPKQTVETIEDKINEEPVALGNEVSDNIQSENTIFSENEPPVEVYKETGITEQENDPENEIHPDDENVEKLVTNPDSHEHFTAEELPNEILPAQAEEEMAVLTRDTDEKTDKFLEDFGNTNDSFTNENQTTNEDQLPPLDDDAEVESTETDEHEQMFQNIKAMLDATSEEADADTESGVIPMDPYYTIDYFASQGIKLDLEPSQDHLGIKVKKFTHWLKTMKKLGPEDATEVIYKTEAEADIRQIADTSNIAREVVTEAMALVLEKQGKREKAVELYNKLSFLNPHKSAYFAAKIKNLKGT